LANFLTLFSLSFAPGLFILWYVYCKDKYEKEPARLIFITFCLGAGVVIPVGVIEHILELIIAMPYEGNFLGAFIFAFLVVAPTEECSKCLCIWVAFRSPHFNEVMDGIVYGVAAAMGFATVENFFYVFEGGVSTGIARAFLSVPSHAMTGAILGYYMGMKKMNPESKKHFIEVGLAIAILFHGAYDFVLLTQTPLSLLVIPIIICLYFFYRKRVYLALKDSPFRAGRDENLFRKP
jgi:RsiW-degrading membrane proteinase PrsW (M82 family)